MREEEGVEGKEGVFCAASSCEITPSGSGLDMVVS